MNKVYLGGFCIAVLFLSLYFYQAPYDKKATEEEDEEDELNEFRAAFEFDLLRQADPHTGTIPSGAVMRAFNELKKRGFYQYTNNNREDSETGWKQVSDFFPSLSVTKLAYDPNNTQVFYFCTGEGWYNADAVKGAGVFKSIDGGETWEQLLSTAITTFDYCQDLVVHPVTSDVYVATRTGGLQRSVDGGATWEKVLGSSVGATRNSVCDIELTADGGVFASIGIFETDGIYFSPSGDAGTFVKQTNGFPTSGIFRIEMATAPSNANVAYAIACNSSDYRIKGIWKTTDKGNTWFETNRPDNNYEFAARQAWYDLSFAVDPNNENVVAMGGLNIWRTRDGGDTWQQLTAGRLDSVLIRYAHVDQHEIVFENSDVVYFGNDGGVYKCTNFTDDIPFIYERNYGYNVTQFYSVAIHPFSGIPQVMGGTQDNGTPYAYDDGIAEYKFVSGGDGAFTAFNHQNPEIFFTASQERRMFRFTNGGFEIPDTISNHFTNDANVLFINPFDIDATDPEVLYQATNIGIWRLSNASVADTAAWVKAGTISGVLTAIETTPAKPGVVFIGRNTGTGDIYRLDSSYTSTASAIPYSIDPNDMLPDAPFLSSMYCSSIYADETDANHVIVTYSNYGMPSIWESVNALSATPVWTNVEGDFPDVPVYSALIHPDKPEVCYIATEIGVFYTDQLDAEFTQWVPCSNFPIVRTDMLKLRPADRMIVAGTHGRGIWQALLGGGDGGTSHDLMWFDRGPINVGGRTRTILVDPNDPTGNTVWAGSIAGGLWRTTDIDAVPVEEIQTSTGTLKIYPNPASHILNLEFFVDGNKHVQIDLISLNGTVAAHLLDANLSGKQILHQTLNAGIPKGIYFVVVNVGDARMVKKVVIN